MINASSANYFQPTTDVAALNIKILTILIYTLSTVFVSVVHSDFV